MRILFIVGTCLTKNTSANMSHNSYIQGFIENGCEVDVIMKNDSWGQQDKCLKKHSGVKYIEYESMSAIDKLIKKHQNRTPITIFKRLDPLASIDKREASTKKSLSKSAKKLLKKLFYMIFPKDPIYPLDKVWIANASHFSSDAEYDIVVSNSSPSASHKLAKVLIDNKRIQTKRWLQIWEDPWYHDLYGNHSDAIKEEERILLEAAQEVYYVSPITTEYQKKFFPSAAHKMKTVLLPYYSLEKNGTDIVRPDRSYGYFGDYYSYTRNLMPFYNALTHSGRKGFIYGDSDMSLKSENIEISRRVTLDVLSGVQERTSVLVHLCNLYGGQIPGKIYHYSATSKPILFILDGTDEEKEILRNFFGKFHRYYICENNECDILNTMDNIENPKGNISTRPIIEFSPKEVVRSLING